MASNYYDDDTVNREALLAQMKQPGAARANTPGIQAPSANAAPTAAPKAEPQTELAKLLDGTGTPGGAPPAEKPSYGRSVGQYGGQLEGFDAGKLNSDHDSPKYLIGRTLSNFDPRKGVTPEVLDALNSLNIGTFSGNRDKLTVGGKVDPRFEGYTNIDVSRGFNDPNRDPNAPGNWQYGAENPNAPAAPAAPQGGGANFLGGPSGLATALGLAGNSNVPTDEGTYNLLQQQLQGILGPESVDRNALLALMRK